MKVTYIDEEI